MACIAATVEAVGIRDEDVSSAEEQAVPSDDGAHMRGPFHSTQYNQMEKDSPPDFTCQNGSTYVATPQEVHDSLDAVNTLRYYKPVHLSGKNTKHQPWNTLNSYFAFQLFRRLFTP